MGRLSALDPVVVLLCAWLGVSAVGLYRLRTWGLVAMICGNIAELRDFADCRRRRAIHRTWRHSVPNGQFIPSGQVSPFEQSRMQ